MKFLRFSICCLVFLLIFACSKESAPGAGEEQVTLPDFRLIGEDADNIYQYTYDASSASGTEINLSQTLGLGANYLTLRQVDALVSFYQFSTGNFSLFQQNTLTGQSRTYPNFYSVSDERAITWGANSEDQIFLGYYSPRGSRDFGIRIMDPSDGSFADQALEASIQQAFEPLYYRERLLITYRAGNGDYKVAIFNTESSEVMETLEFGTAIPNVLIDDAGKIGILIGSGNSEFIYRNLDFETLIQTSERTLTLNEFFPAGPFQGSFYGNTLYYVNSFAQPSAIPFGPAYYDFDQAENYEVDIMGVVQQVENELGTDIDLTSLRFYQEEGLFLIGYVLAGSQTSLEGGVLAVSKTGALLERQSLDFVPTYFIQP